MSAPSDPSERQRQRRSSMYRPRPFPRQGATARPLRVALLAQSHLVQVGLMSLVSACADALALEIGVLSSGCDPVLRAFWAGQAELLIAAPDSLAEAERIVALSGVPLLLYATVETAAELCARPFSMVIGPTSSAELVQALNVVRAGGRYRNCQAEALARLSPRQRHLLLLLLDGATAAEAAIALGLSTHRLRHLICALYDQLGIAHSRAALLTWAGTAPLELIALPG